MYFASLGASVGEWEGRVQAGSAGVFVAGLPEAPWKPPGVGKFYSGAVDPTGKPPGPEPKTLIFRRLKPCLALLPAGRETSAYGIFYDAAARTRLCPMKKCFMDQFVAKHPRIPAAVPSHSMRMKTSALAAKTG
jgi:hypothetical protein